MHGMNHLLFVCMLAVGSVDMSKNRIDEHLISLDDTLKKVYVNSNIIYANGFLVHCHLRCCLDGSLVKCSFEW